MPTPTKKAGSAKTDSSTGKTGGVGASLKKTELELACSLDFLGCEVMAAVQAKSSRTRVIAKQTNAGRAEGITLSDFATRLHKGLQSLMPAGSTVPLPKPEDIKLPTAFKNIADTYQARVHEFMFTLDKEEGKSADLEFALWVQIELDEKGREKLKNEAPFNILRVDKLYLKIWNTTNQGILDKMDFLSFDEILGVSAIEDKSDKDDSGDGGDKAPKPDAEADSK